MQALNINEDTDRSYIESLSWTAADFDQTMEDVSYIDMRLEPDTMSIDGLPGQTLDHLYDTLLSCTTDGSRSSMPDLQSIISFLDHDAHASSPATILSHLQSELRHLQTLAFEHLQRHAEAIRHGIGNDSVAGITTDLQGLDERIVGLTALCEGLELEIWRGQQ